LQLLADRDVALNSIPAPPPPGPSEVRLQVRVVGLNHIDVWGFRGMAFAKRKFPLTVAAEASCEVIAVGSDVTDLAPGDRVVPFGALTCGTCRFCARGQDNLCENVAGVRGFHVDGFAQDITNHPARLAVKIPDGVSLRDGGSTRYHEVDQGDAATVGFEQRLQHKRIGAVAAADTRNGRNRGNAPEPVVRAAEQGGELGGRVEAGQAEPVDRAVIGDQRRRPAIADQRMVFNTRPLIPHPARPHTFCPWLPRQ